MPEPEPDTNELVIRATHVEAPSLDGAQRFPNLFNQQPEEPSEIPAAQDDDEDAPTIALPAADDEAPAGPASEPEQSDLTPQGRYRASVTEAEDFSWKVPNARLLTRSKGEAARPDTSGQERVAKQLVEALGHFGIQAQVVGTVSGPHITRYELRLAPGSRWPRSRSSRTTSPTRWPPPTSASSPRSPASRRWGSRCPNARRRIVQLGDVWQDPPEDYSPLGVWLGKDVAGRAIGADLAKMPHLLVAGTTGAGKSGCINAMLSSILLRATPHDLQIVLVDPKQVELNHYESIPHLVTPVITSPRMAANALANLVREMEERYGMMSLARTRSLVELNRVAREAAASRRFPTSCA